MSSNDKPTVYGRIFPPRPDWLAKAPAEDILEPELEIIDSHHHLWDNYSQYLLPEFLADVGSGHNVVSTVYIECHSHYRTDGPEEMRPVGEVEFVADIAARNESACNVAAGIVGFADLTLGDRLEPVLEALIEAGQGRFRGIRHAGSYHPDPVIGNHQHASPQGLYRSAEFRQGLRLLTKMGFALDAIVYHPQLQEMVDLARACPDANIIMNHVGMPLGYGPYTGRHDEVHADWSKTMLDIAACENVTTKLGGMMMRLAAYDYFKMPAPPSSAQLADYWRPYIEPSIELFGAERCTFESNFPVDKMGIGYAALWNAFKRLAAGASDAEKKALFSGTARRAYQLE
jgi:L-fuconolactonase